MQHSKTHPTRVGTRFDSKISLTKFSIFCLTPKCLWDPDRNAFLDELFPTVVICKTLFSSIFGDKKFLRPFEAGWRLGFMSGGVETP